MDLREARARVSDPPGQDLLCAVERIGQIVDRARNVDALIGEVLEGMLDRFDCDRAWLLHPCNPEARSWSVKVERTRPAWPGALAEGAVVAMDPEVRDLFSDALSQFGPRRYEPGSRRPLPAAAKRFGVQSQMIHAIRPRVGDPWLLGIHHCRRARTFSLVDERLFEDIGRRMSDALTTRLVLQELQSSEAKFRNLADELREVLWTWEPGVGFSFVSRVFEEVWGRPRGHITGQSHAWLRWLDPETRPDIMQAIRQGNEEIDLPILRPDGTRRFVRVRRFVTRGEDGTVLRINGIARDITEQYEAEADERRMSQHLARAERLATVGTLATGMAHEIGNPLAYLQVFLSDLERQPPPLPPGLEQARAAADRIHAVLRRTRLFARGTGQQKGPVRFADLVDATLGLIRSQVERCGTVRLRVDQDAAVEGVRDELLQVLLNLMLNGAQAASEVPHALGLIELTVEIVGAEVVIEVHDNGRGVPEDVVRRMFDPFFTTREVNVGTGLGLSVCHGIVTRHGGTIEVESRPGLGTVVRVRMPAVASQIDAPGRPAMQVVPVREGRAVLIVDDDPHASEAMALALSEEFEVTVVRSGREALDAIRTRPYHAIICDVLMPGMSGVEVFEGTIADRPEAAERFIFVTGGVFEEGMREIIERSGRPCLHKPVSLFEIRDRVRGMP